MGDGFQAEFGDRAGRRDWVGTRNWQQACWDANAYAGEFGVGNAGDDCGADGNGARDSGHHQPDHPGNCHRDWFFGSRGNFQRFPDRHRTGANSGADLGGGHLGVDGDRHCGRLWLVADGIVCHDRSFRHPLGVQATGSGDRQASLKPVIVVLKEIVKPGGKLLGLEE